MSLERFIPGDSSPFPARGISSPFLYHSRSGGEPGPPYPTPVAKSAEPTRPTRTVHAQQGWLLRCVARGVKAAESSAGRAAKGWPGTASLESGQTRRVAFAPRAFRKRKGTRLRSAFVFCRRCLMLENGVSPSGTGDRAAVGPAAWRWNKPTGAGEHRSRSCAVCRAPVAARLILKETNHRVRLFSCQIVTLTLFQSLE